LHIFEKTGLLHLSTFQLVIAFQWATPFMKKVQSLTFVELEVKRKKSSMNHKLLITILF